MGAQHQRRSRIPIYVIRVRRYSPEGSETPPRVPPMYSFTHPRVSPVLPAVLSSPSLGYAISSVDAALSSQILATTSPVPHLRCHISRFAQGWSWSLELRLREWHLDIFVSGLAIRKEPATRCQQRATSHQQSPVNTITALRMSARRWGVFQARYHRHIHHIIRFISHRIAAAAAAPHQHQHQHGSPANIANRIPFPSMQQARRHD